jgi:phosphonoacetate hydrolase
MPTIGRRLTDAGVSWAWYSGGFDGAVAGHPDPTFIYHHQPFAYFADYAAGTPGRAEHLKDERDMLRAIRDRTLPAVFELVLDKETVCKHFELPIDREGDFAAFSDRQTVVGARREDHDLSQLAGHRLRSHGGLGEQRVPFLVSTPLDPGWLAAHPRLRNYDIFDAALNAAVT